MATAVANAATRALVANKPKRARRTNQGVPKSLKGPLPKIEPKAGLRTALSTEELRDSLNPNGNTVIRDFGRLLRDEPHKYIYPYKLYMMRKKVKVDAVMDWLRDRYINSTGGFRHGARYEVRSYKAGVNGDGTDKRFVDYILLEQFTDEDRVLFTVEFGQVTTDKIIRDGKLRRPRLKKDEKAVLDSLINRYYLRVSARRKRETAELAERRSLEAASSAPGARG